MLDVYHVLGMFQSMSHESHPVLLTRNDLEFVILRGFQKIRQIDRRATTFKDPVKAERGWTAQMATLMAQFDDLEVYRRPGLGHPCPPEKR